MAFSFSQNPAPTLGASAPTFGSIGAAIGVTPTPAFGAQQTPSFGQTSFGSQQAATPAPAPLFGAAPAAPLSSQPMFGSQSQSAFSFGKPSTPAFSFSSTSSPMFGSTSSTFGSSQAAPAFGGSQFSFQQQQQQQQQQQYGALTTVDGKPITNSTKWEEMSPACQNVFIEMQKMITEAKEDARLLDADPRLQGPPHDTLDAQIAALSNELAGVGNRLTGDTARVAEVREDVLGYHDDLHAAQRTFSRGKKWREASRAAQGQGIPMPSILQDGAPVVLLSPFLRKAVDGLVEGALKDNRILEELERAQPPANEELVTDPALLLLQSLRNTNDSLIYVAAELNSQTERISALKVAHLARLRQAGDYTDPFAEADRREELEQQAKVLAEARQRDAQSSMSRGAAPVQPAAPSAAAPQPAFGATPPGSSPLLPSASAAGVGQAVSSAWAAPALPAIAASPGLGTPGFTISSAPGAFGTPSSTLPRNNSMARKGKSKK